MREVAGLYKDEGQKRKYLNAAARFRLPFWDPFMPRNELEDDSSLETIFGIPEILRAKNVFVKHWDERGPQEILNPLQSFFFPNGATLEAKGRLTWVDDDWSVVSNDRAVPHLGKACIDISHSHQMGDATRFELRDGTWKPTMTGERDSILC